MNDDNRVNAQTLLFGFLSEYAQQNRFSTTLNKKLKEEGVDAMCVPMNIRPDDFYFTVSGLRNAQLTGVAIGNDFRHEVLELLDGKSEEVSACGFCDILSVKDGKLYGEVMVGKAIAAVLNDKGVKSLALYGSGALAKSVVMHLDGSGVEKVVLFNDRIESCMELMQSVPLQEIEVDIERCNAEIEADFSGCDAALNSANQTALFSPVKSAGLMIDLCDKASPFRDVADKEYMGYNELLDYINETARNIWFEGEK